MLPTKPEGSESHVKEQAPFNRGFGEHAYMRRNNQRQSRVPHLVEIVPHMLHDGLQPQPGLLCSGDDLVGWQEEAIVPSISQLKRERVLDAMIIRPVNAAPASWICKSGKKTPLNPSSFQG